MPKEDTQHLLSGYSPSEQNQDQTSYKPSLETQPLNSPVTPNGPFREPVALRTVPRHATPLLILRPVKNAGVLSSSWGAPLWNPVCPIQVQDRIPPPIFANFISRANEESALIVGKSGLLTCSLGIFLMLAGLFLFFVVPFIGIAVDAPWVMGLGYLGGMLSGGAGALILVLGIIFLSKMWQRRRECIFNLIPMLDSYPIRIAYGPASSHALYFYRPEDCQVFSPPSYV
mmetsp:Transcript_32219/g.80824  ORF Transcript_32219/g.80824 Transcript_32219/m.80824 type:complete len:229 (-) Transcript_32219:143-829(-)